jgi:hypothetical protein
MCSYVRFYMLQVQSSSLAATLVEYKSEEREVDEFGNCVYIDETES